MGPAFTHTTGASGGLHMPEIMSSGAAFLDFDNDGRIDIYLTNGNEHIPYARVSTRFTNRLFQQGEDGTFRDVTESSGLGDGRYGMGMAVGDVDNDGFVDVYVTNFGEDRLYRNNGDGTFSDVTQASGIRADGWSCSAAFVDFDRDGLLDLYVTRYLKYEADKPCKDRAGRPNYCSPQAFQPEADLLFRNLGDARFEDVTMSSSVGSVSPAAGLGVVAADFDGDGWQDIYVANDGYANRLFRNLGDGTFKDEAMIRGAAYNDAGMPEAGMGVLAADFDDDEDLDLFMTHLTNETNTIYRNDGATEGFTDATVSWGLATESMPFTGFGTVALDLQHDGDLDILIADGRVSRLDARPDAEPPAPWNHYAEPNLVFVQQDGKFRADRSIAPDFSERVEVSRALASADIDRDGDLDILLTNTEGAARLYRNMSESEGHWLVIEAVDPSLRRAAIGATVTVTVGERVMTRLVTRSSGYLSAQEPLAHFGLGTAEHVDKMVIRWPDGSRELFAVPKVDVRMRVEARSGQAVTTTD